MSESKEEKTSFKKMLLLTLAALGVVYGDIGTSPLYSVNEIFFGKSHVLPNPANVYGCIGLVIWSLTIVITIKYIIFVMRADNEGEGGVFALSSLINALKKKSNLFIAAVSGLLIFASGLLIGDGMITPAISVVSAVEGLSIITNSLTAFVIPITLVILTILFCVQRQGTAKVGKIFGPVIVVWLLSIGLIGLFHIFQNPEIFKAINPIYIINFVRQVPFYRLLLVLGSVMLVVTGGEAMYADMGHFGKLPIRISWFSLVYPALLLNYLGQGAYLLSGKAVIGDNIFYSMVPGFALIPMVILATLAAVIASQALISGAFSLAKQAIALGLFPRLKIIHTHLEHEGQLYVPMVNWMLYFGSAILVLVFQSSNHLASAYGLAVSGVMLVTALGIFIISQNYWHWPAWVSVLVIGPMFVLDSLFFSANTLKIVDGGYIPLLVAVVVFVIMKTWNWGKSKAVIAEFKYPSMTVKELIEIKHRSEKFIPRSMIILTPRFIDNDQNKIPALEQLFWDKYGMLPKNIIFLTVVQHKLPFMHKDRHEVLKLYYEPEHGSVFSVKLNFGFMEEPNVENQLEGLIRHHEISIPDHPDDILVQVIDDQMVISENVNGFKKFIAKFYKFMDSNAMTTITYFNLAHRIKLSSEILQVKIR